MRPPELTSCNRRRSECQETDVTIRVALLGDKVFIHGFMFMIPDFNDALEESLAVTMSRQSQMVMCIEVELNATERGYLHSEERRSEVFLVERIESSPSQIQCAHARV